MLGEENTLKDFFPLYSMKLGVLLSGGKDSNYSMYLAKKAGNEIVCLMTLLSKNTHSYMFQKPSVSQTKKQAEVLNLPLLSAKTPGEKEYELSDLEKIIKKAIKKYKIEGIVTGAVRSEYQASRIQKICDALKIKCINPLWQKDQIELLKEIVKEKFEVVIVGVGAYPLDKTWLGRKIDEKFIREVEKLQEKYKINPSGEGGEFESFVLNSPLFSRPLKIKSFKDSGEGNSWQREVKIE